MSTAAAERRQGTPGCCTNLDYCSIGMQRQVITVPVGEPFACPECARPLRPPGLRGWQRPIVLPALRIAILCLGIGLGVILGYRIGRLVPARDTGAPALAASPAAEPPPISSPMSSPLQPAVSLRPFPARVPPPDTADPPQHLLHEQRYGQVVLDCIFAPPGGAACHPGDIRGSDAFSAVATQWLQSLSPLYPLLPGIGQGHRWRVIIQDFAGQAPGR
jgi:hypothetical protein